MSRKSEHVKAWRKRTKSRMVAAFGNKCCRCKGEFPSELYDFHHLIPSEKEFSLGSARGSIVSWNRLVGELKKCVLLCANCHRGVECNLYKVPENAQRFNEDYTDYKNLLPKPSKYALHDCPICGSNKVPKRCTYCSHKCAAISRRKMKNRPSLDKLLKLIKAQGWESTGRMFGVTGNAIRKWIIEDEKYKVI